MEPAAYHLSELKECVYEYFVCWHIREEKRKRNANALSVNVQCRIMRSDWNKGLGELSVGDKDALRKRGFLEASFIARITYSHGFIKEKVIPHWPTDR